jgi:PKD repeat protein
VKIGNPESGLTVDIAGVLPFDMGTGAPRQSFNVNEVAHFNVTVRNLSSGDLLGVVVAINIYDKNCLSLGAMDMLLPLSPNSTGCALFTRKIPEWAYIGGAKAVANVFTDYPENGGVAYSLEKSTTFNITRGPGTVDFEAPNLDIPSSLGSYNVSYKLSPESKNGTYRVYATGESGAMRASQSTTFQVEAAGNPPQASFTFTPSQPYVNQVARFDASASSPEGYDDAIVRYEWKFGDDNSTIILSGNKTNPPPSTVQHTFVTNGTYIVTLNVTDTENLWCTTSKQITIRPPTGPTADFTWTRVGNLTVGFDASSSLPGWNGTGEALITSYKWDFGDFNTTTVSAATIIHQYATEGNYSVTLTVKDSQNLTDNITQTVRVQLIQFPPWDINQDGYVNAKDAVILGAHFNTQQGDPGYLAAADINGDTYVNAKDAVILGTHFNEA